MHQKNRVPNLDLAEIFKKYEKEHGPVKEPKSEEIIWGKPKGKEVW